METKPTPRSLNAALGADGDRRPIPMIHGVRLSERHLAGQARAACPRVYNGTSDSEIRPASPEGSSVLTSLGGTPRDCTRLATISVRRLGRSVALPLARAQSAFDKDLAAFL